MVKIFFNQKFFHPAKNIFKSDLKTCISFYNSYITEKIFRNFVITLLFKNKKLNVALSYNVKPEVNSTSDRTPLSLHHENTYSNDIFAEWDTMDTINAVKNALEKYNNVTMIEANEDAFEKFRAVKPDIVFNIAEGFYGIGREAQIPAMLEMLNIPYTGSDPLTLATCLNKARTKEILSYYKIPNAKFRLLESIEGLKDFDLAFPVMIKPVGEGSSKGIYNKNFINSLEELNSVLREYFPKYNQPFIAEEFLNGREFTVAVIGNGEEARIFPIVEINFDELPEGAPKIYSYEAKWIYDTRENPLKIFTCPAQIDKKLEDEIRKTVLNTYKVLNCRDWSRIDVRLDKNNTPNIIEVNPLPGILPDPEDNSCYPKAARSANVPYDEMLNLVLHSAVKRYNLI